jgi:hypothetical protein
MLVRHPPQVAWKQLYVTGVLLLETSVPACVCLPAPGGQWQQLKDYGELDMANPTTLSNFLQGGLARCVLR